MCWCVCLLGCVSDMIGLCVVGSLVLGCCCSVRVDLNVFDFLRVIDMDG